MRTVLLMKKPASPAASQTNSSTHIGDGEQPNERARRSKPKMAGDGDPAGGPGLYLVATPIGNAGDISRRALDLLARADIVACEDTRVTAKLFAIHGIKAPLIAYHEHNAERMRPILIEHLENGETVALVSDAGTPLISDPGYKLVRDVVAAGLPMTALPGASAVLTALVLSGLPTNRFLFAGFLPAKQVARRRELTELVSLKASLVFLESKQRLARTLADMAEVLGPRPAAVARELTKMFEEVRRAPLSALADHYAQAGPPKGEVTIVVGPPDGIGDGEPPEALLDAALTDALTQAPVSAAARQVAGDLGLPRKLVYVRALALKKSRAEDEPS
jgi:16S rRNA (cytidine1402-2'-O)-methyltransferase